MKNADRFIKENGLITHERLAKKQKQIREREADIKEALNIMTSPNRDALATAEEILELSKELIELKNDFVWYGELSKIAI